MKTHTLYEFPLNERIRVFIRLEQLLLQHDHFMSGSTIFDKRASVSVLLDILMIFSRSDLKSELLKELDRHSKILGQIARSQAVDAEKLDKILTDLNIISKKLYQANGKIGINVMESDLFQSISQRSSIPGGTCSFDLPAFHYWLEQDNSNQADDLLHWTKPFVDIRKAINLILDFIRQSSIPTSELAESGFFQLSLDNTQPYQLLMISIEKTLPCFAEISGGKHRFTIRFMKPSADNNRPSQFSQDVAFSLTRCLL
ncbi:MAG: cell division protein ZapD [Methylococcales symbiont of Hymedesmia sp. n. MRB-2018]|nr:MAG: cell division protein ZapD [Methylococcales symbiont of Hymedesmia sp. n. MRB-2018]KAF3983486.1 MAG: cell division protein ZapD [Methylococcales symbiont of Hymedesmia sp. n. MRB-2018]